jgi:hypothetical protein
VPNKCHFFCWLVLHGRCWTSDHLQRHGLSNNGPCALSSQHAETIDHLLVSYVFSREVWFRVFRRCGWQNLVPGLDDLFINWWLRCRKRVIKDRQKCFDSLIILVIWQLWLQRNARVFHSSCLSVAVLAQAIWSECVVWGRAKIISGSLIAGE